MLFRNLVLILVLFGAIEVQAEVATVDLITGGSCGITSRVAGGRVTSFQPFDTPPPITNNITCYFTMRAVKNREKVRFVFEHFDLQPTDCAVSNLEIYNGAKDSDPLLTTLCPGDNVVSREFLSTSFYLTLKLNVAAGGITPPLANFSGYWVSYTDNFTPCFDPSLQMTCSNARCIYQELQCDGLDSCGDNTDESTDPPQSCASTTTEGPDLTALYVTLTLALAMFCAYLTYALLAVDCFKSLMMKCLTQCCVHFIRRRRKWREAKYKTNQSQTKVFPQEDKKALPVEDLTIEDIAENV